jgi:hypothetical protein
VKFLVLVLVFVGGDFLNAQIVELSGGTLSLYQSQGGTVSIRNGTYTTSVGRVRWGGSSMVECSW